VVSFTNKLPYNCSKNSHQPSDRRLSTSQSCFGDYKEKKNLCPCLELTPISQSSNLLLSHYTDRAMLMLLIHIMAEVKKKKPKGIIITILSQSGTMDDPLQHETANCQRLYLIHRVFW
jgi:hypothetical protein